MALEAESNRRCTRSTRLYLKATTRRLDGELAAGYRCGTSVLLEDAQRIACLKRAAKDALSAVL